LASESKQLEKGILAKYIIATLCIVSIFAISIFHSRYIDHKISDISKAYLSKITIQSADIMNSQINSNFESLELLARMIGNLDDFQTDKILKAIQNESQNSKYIKMGVVLQDGTIAFITKENNIEYETQMQLANDWKYIQKVMRGGASFSGSNTRSINNQTANVYATPIVRNMSIVGALVVYYNYEFFDGFVIPEAFDNKGYSYISDSRGNIIFAGDGTPRAFSQYAVVEALSDSWALKGSAGDRLKKDIQDNKSGTIEYHAGNNGSYISYTPIDFNNWYMISIVPTSIAEEQTAGVYDDIVPSILYALIIIISLAVYVIFIRNESLKQLERRIKQQSVNDESYRLIMEKTNDMIFEYNTVTKTYLHTENFEKTFGYQPTKKGFLGALESDYVHPDDTLQFVKFYEEMKRERELCETEVRIIKSDGSYLWTRIYMIGVYDCNGNMIRVIGKFVNIDQKRKEMEHLMELAVKDSATGVYNKQTTKNLINNYLENEGKSGKHAMLIIDIDDFKGVNDDYGHRLGDKVIAELGAGINNIFRTSDIKGRIGGDEFMILMKNMDSLELVTQKAKAICDIFKDKKIDEKKDVKVSTSIGISIYGKDGNTYDELYEAADRALYSCKNIQKGTYAFME